MRSKRQTRFLRYRSLAFVPCPESSGYDLKQKYQYELLWAKWLFMSLRDSFAVRYCCRVFYCMPVMKAGR